MDRRHHKIPANISQPAERPEKAQNTKMVLRPGFEPGSRAREARILDRTILPEQLYWLESIETMAWFYEYFSPVEHALMSAIIWPINVG